MDSRHWDDRYRRHDRLFSGNPNPVLVTEVADLLPRRALDVGCGEGADARWLARRGWQVTAMDVSRVTLDRARQTEKAVHWMLHDPTATPPPPGAFDLVTISYFPLRITPDHAALRGLLAAVAAGGTLLFTTHAPMDLHRDPADGFDPADFYQPVDIVPLLDDRWIIEVNEVRRRSTSAPTGTHHTHDAILRARLSCWGGRRRTARTETSRRSCRRGWSDPGQPGRAHSPDVPADRRLGGSDMARWRGTGGRSLVPE